MSETSSSAPHSHHIFVFPFKWDYLSSGQSILETRFSERTSASQFSQALKEMPWEESPFKIGIDKADQYHTFNEYNYFYGYARDALALSLNEQQTKQRYRYKFPDKQTVPKYKITVENGKEVPYVYALDIEDIILTSYDIGVGYIAFFLANHETESKEDVLRINDYGRRIYPQFLGSSESKEYLPTDAPKDSFLASEISISGLGIEIAENFSYYDSAASLQGEPYKLPAHISKLLGSQFKVGTRESKQRYSRSYILLNPLIDDRMFTHCIYYPAEGLEAFRSFDEERREYSYTGSDFWYAYLFVDPDIKTTCHSRPMKKKLLKEHTYDRWIEYKNQYGFQSHLFGVSRYSFMIVAERQWFAQTILLNHHRYIYFQMIALSLMQRGAIIRFSAEAANISESIIGGLDSPSRQKQSIRDIYQGYLYFINKIHFRELTPQEQGIELYDMARRAMEIDSDMQALHQEIGELHQYAVLLDGEKSSEQAERLTWIAIIFLPFSVIGTYFGLSKFPESAHIVLIFTVISILLLILIVLSIRIIPRIRKF